MTSNTAIKISPINIDERRNLDFRAGDTVRVWQRVKEGDKTRIQAFEGLVISRKHGKEPGATFTVRKVSGGVGVERTFPLYLPTIEKIEIVRRAKARRAKLYYVRRKAAKEIRRKMRQLRPEKESSVPKSNVEAPQEAAETEEEAKDAQVAEPVDAQA